MAADVPGLTDVNIRIPPILLKEDRVRSGEAELTGEVTAIKAGMTGSEGKEVNCFYGFVAMVNQTLTTSAFKGLRISDNPVLF